MNDEMWIFIDKGTVIDLQSKIQFEELDFTSTIHFSLFTLTSNKKDTRKGVFFVSLCLRRQDRE